MLVKFYNNYINEIFYLFDNLKKNYNNNAWKLVKIKRINSLEPILSGVSIKSYVFEKYH